MDLINETLKHKSLGVGRITEFDGQYLKVEFASETSKFRYPASFDTFLTLNNSDKQADILAELARAKQAEADKKRAEEEALRKAQKEREALQTSYAGKQKATSKKERPERFNLAFKCNYCNGGARAERVGYEGVCSDKIIAYNIETKKRTWCSNDMCPCKLYYDGYMTRKDLDAHISYSSDEEGFVCYESQMLIKWRAFAGATKEGNKKKKILHAQKNSLCVLTASDPGDKGGKNRYIFGIFLIDENYEGDDYDEGYVGAHPEYRLEMKPAEARKLLFWDYYQNPNAPDNKQWGSGLFRYFNDDVAVEILKKAVDLKKGTIDGEKAKKFLSHFCEIVGYEVG